MLTSFKTNTLLLEKKKNFYELTSFDVSSPIFRKCLIKSNNCSANCFASGSHVLADFAKHVN